jgi:molecular chaperone HscB
MDFFELYQMQPSFIIDKSVLQKKMYQLSRKFHPDFFTNATPHEQEEALQQTTKINEAYKILSSQDDTIFYVLQHKNVIEANEKYNLDNNFLVSMMDFNEEILDAKASNNLAKLLEIKNEIAQIEQSNSNNIEGLLSSKLESLTEENYITIKEYYFKKKYITRILDIII